MAFSLGTVASDDGRAPGVEIGKPSDTYRRVRINSTFGTMAVLVTDGHLPYPYGREITGYEVPNLSETLSKAKAAGAVCDAEFAEIERRRERYLGNRERAEVAGRTAIVIDDGIATGATTRAALRATRMRNPKRLVLAVPVAPSDSLSELRREADDIVCLEDHLMFGAIGFYYHDFRQVSDEEVIEILQRFPAGKPCKSSLAGSTNDSRPDNVPRE